MAAGKRKAEDDLEPELEIPEKPATIKTPAASKNTTSSQHTVTMRGKRKAEDDLDYVPEREIPEKPVTSKKCPAFKKTAAKYVSKGLKRIKSNQKKSRKYQAISDEQVAAEPEGFEKGSNGINKQVFAQADLQKRDAAKAAKLNEFTKTPRDCSNEILSAWSLASTISLHLSRQICGVAQNTPLPDILVSIPDKMVLRKLVELAKLTLNKPTSTCAVIQQIVDTRVTTEISMPPVLQFGDKMCITDLDTAISRAHRGTLST